MEQALSITELIEIAAETIRAVGHRRNDDMTPADLYAAIGSLNLLITRTGNVCTDLAAQARHLDTTHQLRHDANSNPVSATAEAGAALDRAAAHLAALAAEQLSTAQSAIGHLGQLIT